MAKQSMGTVRYNSRTGNYEARIQHGVKANGKPNVKVFYDKDEKEAKKKLEVYKAKVLLFGVAERVKSISLSAYVLEWLELHKKAELKPRAYDTIESTVKTHIIPNLGMIQVGAVTSTHIQRVLNQMVDDGYSYSTYKKVYQALNGIFTQAIKEYAIDKNPMTGVTRLKADSDRFPEPRDIVFLETDDIEKFTIEARREWSNNRPVYRMGLGLILMLHTGIRSAEALGLRFRHINLVNNEMYVQETLLTVKNRNENAATNYTQVTGTTKTKTSRRTVHLTPKAVEAINALNNLYHYAPDDYIFHAKNNNPYQERNLRRLLNNVLTKADTTVQNVGLHTLRHTFASNMWKHGVDIKTISQQLGHKDSSFTMDTYIHVFGDTVIKSFERMDMM